MDTPILKSLCRFPGKIVLNGSISLSNSEVVLTGWALTGRFERIVNMADIGYVRWWSGHHRMNFAIYLKSGERIPLHIKSEAAMWKSEIDLLLGKTPWAASQMPKGGTARDSKVH